MFSAPISGCSSRRYSSRVEDRHAQRTGRVVDDHGVADLGADRLGDRAEVLDRERRRPVRRARVQVDHPRRPRPRPGAPRRRTPRACRGSPGHCSREASAPDIAQVRMTGASIARRRYRSEPLRAPLAAYIPRSACARGAPALPPSAGSGRDADRRPEPDGRAAEADRVGRGTSRIWGHRVLDRAGGARRGRSARPRTRRPPARSVPCRARARSAAAGARPRAAPRRPRRARGCR